MHVMKGRIRGLLGCKVV